jgi:SAM-dependent methyltransferase
VTLANPPSSAISIYRSTPVDRDGVLDFVSDTTDERAWYDTEYAGQREPIDPTTLAARWHSTYFPMDRDVLNLVGDLRGKTIALIGNGTSAKELHFLAHGPERLVFSDYSAAAVRAVRDAFPVRGLPIDFAAIDATCLPFHDGSIDVVYGYAFVHHLSDPPVFVREAIRVLRPGGRAVFMDNPRSPVYQALKLTVLRPLMRYYHRKGNVSPEDLRATMTGWYSVEELDEMLRGLGVEPFFRRSLLVHYLVLRASERLPPRRLFEAYQRSTRAQQALIRLDGWMARFRIVRANQMRLVWGFEKP